jgi:hypothetical protein
MKTITKEMHEKINKHLYEIAKILNGVEIDEIEDLFSTDFVEKLAALNGVSERDTYVLQVD